MVSVAESFKNKTVLITGVTGFIGKVLLEKLLRSCQGISKIYVIIREKRGENETERLRKMLTLECFSVLRLCQPNFERKIVALKGNLTQENLGLSCVDIKTITTEVSVVFHCAATVKFLEPLNDALVLNVIAVNCILKLCRDMKNLKAMVHLSTAYSHCYLSHIKEQFYPLEGDLEFDVSKYSATEDYCELNKKVLNKFPNTYTYTKALAENLISDYKRKFPDLPITIVRPSIVSTSWKDPFPGWCDSFNGPVGLIVAFGKGLLRSLIANYESITNFIPVDFTANVCLIAAWVLMNKKRVDGNVTICNCTASSDENVLLWGKFIVYMNQLSGKYPLDNPFRIPAFKNAPCRNMKVYKIQCFIRHSIPAFIVDCLMVAIGKKAIFTRIYKKLHSATENLSYFTLRSWSWKRDNVLESFSLLGQKDKEIYPVDTSTIDWEKHAEDYHIGTKKYILKEDMCNVNKMKRQMYYRKILSNIFNVIIALTIVYFSISTLK